MTVLRKQVNEKKEATYQQAASLADELADRPYGKTKSVSLPMEFAKTSISVPKLLLEEAEDLVRKNKRDGRAPKNVSSLMRMLLEEYLSGRK